MYGSSPAWVLGCLGPIVILEYQDILLQIHAMIPNAEAPVAASQRLRTDPAGSTALSNPPSATTYPSIATAFHAADEADADQGSSRMSHGSKQPD